MIKVAAGVQRTCAARGKEKELKVVLMQNHMNSIVAQTPRSIAILSEH